MKTKQRIANVLALALLAAGTCGWAVAQAKEEAPDRAVVPLSNPAKPAKIEVSVMRGSITIKGYDGKDVVVEARAREKALLELGDRYTLGGHYAVAMPAPPAQPAPAAVPAPAPKAKAGEAEVRPHTEEELLARQLADQERLAKRIARAGDYYVQFLQEGQKSREEKEKRTAGLKRLSSSSSGLEVEENDNVVSISAQSWKAATDLVIQVPRTSSLEVRSSMDGAVVVEDVSGEIDINNINGPVTLTSVSGNTLVHTVNGDITVILNRVSADKPLSFSTMKGDIDVTLPADVKANLKMKSDQGEIYTDFDMSVSRKATRAEETGKTEAGKYHITFDKSLLGQVNGGGQEMSFTTFGGDIYIRKKK
ncbi:MAG TPA: DUF4097 family beta strand repeat-containing protein [Candidatus Aminicenantes bacterium]|nr:DUF4097 family beta strand repeat-containing protein [Candidatus Aminicenantes bacterium]HRY63946.1 DUF4097 family beta strand repeat-containing protein [Candidatus Aminicenantes bacterium]HRZ70859.1 DUF4097 family beta strand repeat-containing protein [Candidatus Aminicenantes bacterium]